MQIKVKLINHEHTKDKCFPSPSERRFTPSNGQDVLEKQKPESIQALLEVPQQSYEAQIKVRNSFILKDETKEDKEVEDYFVTQGKEREREITKKQPIAKHQNSLSRKIEKQIQVEKMRNRSNGSVKNLKIMQTMIISKKLLSLSEKKSS